MRLWFRSTARLNSSKLNIFLITFINSDSHDPMHQCPKIARWSSTSCDCLPYFVSLSLIFKWSKLTFVVCSLYFLSFFPFFSATFNGHFSPFLFLSTKPLCIVGEKRTTDIGTRGWLWHVGHHSLPSLAIHTFPGRASSSRRAACRPPRDRREARATNSQLSGITCYVTPYDAQDLLIEKTLFTMTKERKKKDDLGTNLDIIQSSFFSIKCFAGGKNNAVCFHVTGDRRTTWLCSFELCGWV